MALARALAADPTFLLLDEPNNHLDLAGAQALMNALRAEVAAGTGVVAVLHDLTLAAQADRLLLLHAGELLAHGTPEQVLTPAHLHAAYGLHAEVLRHRGRLIVVPQTGEQLSPALGSGPMSVARPPYFRTAGHLLLCQHTNCAARGAKLLYQALWNALEREKLAYFKSGGSLRLTGSGCLGACSYGPVLCVYRQRAAVLEEGWYVAADLLLALRVARAVHAGEELPQERKYGP